MEKLIDVPKFEGIYKISDKGYIINTKTNRILKSKSKKFYCVGLYDGSGIKKHFQLNRLIYSSFYNIKLRKNHLIIPKDGDVMNCSLSNLKMITSRNYTAVKMSNKTGLTGVYKIREGYYVARITFENSIITLLLSKDINECHKLYQLAKTLIEEYDSKKTQILSSAIKNKLISKSVKCGNF